MVNLPDKAGDMDSDPGRFSCVRENLQKVRFPVGRFGHSKKNNSGQSKDGGERIFPLLHVRKHPPTEKGGDE